VKSTLRAHLAGSTVACFLALFVPTAHADRPSASGTAETSLADSLRGEAKAAFDSANLLITNQDFSGASTKLNQAYSLSKDPRLLFNMALCERNLHHYARMQTLLKQYEHDAGASLAPENRQKVEDALRAISNLVGTVNVAVAETGAVVAIDGADVGTTPLVAPVPLDLGTHTLTVRKEGFDPFEKTLDVAGGNETAVTVTLVRSVPSHLTVSADSNALILVDDAPSVSRRFDGPLAPGTHNIRVTEPGRIPYASSIDLHVGENRTLEVTLENEKHGTLLWPWIVGGVAVAAGAAVGGYFLFKSNGASGEAAPPDGTLEPGTVMLHAHARGFQRSFGR